jgi:hypothetical protein
LVEFKPVFEFICLISFEKKNCKPFPSPPLAYLAFGPARLTQHCGPARNRSRAAQLRSPPRGPLQPASPPPPCLADRWDPSVITFTSPEPAVRPHRAASRRVPRTPAPPPLGPHAQATRDVYKSRRHLLPYPFAPTRVTLATPPDLRTLGAAAAIGLRLRRLFFVVGQCGSSAWR